MHLNSELLFRKHLLQYFTTGLKVLEIGPAGYPSAYQKIVNNPSLTWHTIDFASTTFIDYANNKLTYCLEGAYQFPIPSDEYNIILSGQVIEHVEKIWLWLAELKRITKPGGCIMTINPVSWPYHEAPIDCWRIFPMGINALASETKMKVRLNVFESLEREEVLKIDPKTKFIAGQSYTYNRSTKYLKFVLGWNRFIRLFPRISRHLEIPVEVAYDTVSILEK